MSSTWWMLFSVRKSRRRRIESRASGLEFGEGQVLEFLLPVPHADAFGERHVDLGRLGGLAPAPVRIPDAVEGAHVVQTVGELDQQHPDVARKREDQLAEVLRLPRSGGLQFDFRQVGDAVHKTCDLAAEQLADVRDRRVRILDRVVEQGGYDRGAVQPDPGEKPRDLDGM